MTALLNLLAAVALLVWGTHIVRSGIVRVFGADLRRVLADSVSNRFKAFAAGLGVTALLQSSTATALIATSFVGSGLIATAPALAIMLGADVSTSLLAVVLSFDLSWLSPLLIITGVVLFLSYHGRRAGRIGRILIGLGVIILALRLIVEATQPMRTAESVKVLFATLTGDMFLDLLLAALVTLLCHSSLAVVLLIAALTTALVIPADVALALVVGANLGSGLLAALVTARTTPEARRVALGNLVFKIAGCVIMLPLLDFAQDQLAAWVEAPGAQVLYFHVLFNVVIAVLFIGLTEVVGSVVERLLPAAPPQGSDESLPRYLDPVALDSPTLAISCAAREVLRLGDMVERMLQGVIEVLRSNDTAKAALIRKMDNDVDRLYAAIKTYLTQISREALDEREGRRWAEIISLTINLEHVGDIVDKNLMELAEKKARKQWSFSEAGMAEIEHLHGRVVANLQLGLNIFVNPDLRTAQRLIAEKEQFRNLERAYSESHLRRLQEQTPQSIETSALHLDIIRDLKRINSHICAIAYPTLEQAGVLRPSRLRTAE
jgi:phosphate:Na+ symporter